MNDRDQEIREHAYRMWEEEGRPEGVHEDHWRRAEEHIGKHEQGADGEASENWKVEAGLADSKQSPSVMPTVIPPD